MARIRWTPTVIARAEYEAYTRFRKAGGDVSKWDDTWPEMLAKGLAALEPTPAQTAVDVAQAQRRLLRAISATT